MMIKEEESSEVIAGLKLGDKFLMGANTRLTLKFVFILLTSLNYSIYFILNYCDQ